MSSHKIYNIDARDMDLYLEPKSVQMCVTSPPYFGLRDYKVAGQIGLEATPDEYIAEMVRVFRKVRDVLADDGTLWLNIGDSYATGTKADRQQSTNPGVGANRPEAQNSVARIGNPNGCKTKDLIGIPWLLAFALRADGWWLRQDIIWHKPNPMPESVRDRCTKAHEYIFLLSKSERYFFDNGAIKEQAIYTGLTGQDASGFKDPMKFSGKHNKANSFARKTATTPPPGQPNQRRPDREDVEYSGTRNKRSVWKVATRPYSGAHFAVFPPALIEPCILAGSRVGDVVLDPFMGSGTTAQVALQHGRRAVGCELNTDYLRLIDARVSA